MTNLNKVWNFTTPWSDGYDSFGPGDTNPYEPGTENYYDWEQGYQAAIQDDVEYHEWLIRQDEEGEE